MRKISRHKTKSANIRKSSPSSLGFVFLTFIQNLKPGFAKFICNKDCKTIEDTYQEACKTEKHGKFATCPYNGNFGQSSRSNFWVNNINKRKKYSKNNNSGNNNCLHYPKIELDKPKCKEAFLHLFSYSPSHFYNNIHVTKSSSSKSSKDNIILPFSFLSV